MTPEELAAARRELVERHGPWTHHDFQLRTGEYTIGGAEPIGRNALRLQRLVQTVADVAGRPLRELRVLDLASHEGMNALEFGSHDAEVVAIEAREASLEKARFAQRALGLDNVTFLQGDVRDLSAEAHGRFDLVLCLGILYHLDAPDVFELLARISDVCERLALFDTHVAAAPDEERTWQGRTYAGRRYAEHDPSSTPEERERRLKASIDNPESFWLTRASLLNALADVGFTSVHEVLNPGMPSWADRPTFLALKGEPQRVRLEPRLGSEPAWRWDERRRERLHPQQRRTYQLAVRHPWLRRAARRLPPGLRAALRRYAP